MTLRSLLLAGVLAATSAAARAQGAPDPAVALPASADAAEGERIALVCRQCHSFDKGGAAMQGPPLWNLLGSPCAAAAGFAYSPAFEGAEGRKVGRRRPVSRPDGAGAGRAGHHHDLFGVKKPKDRADLIAFLHLRSDRPAPP